MSLRPNFGVIFFVMISLIMHYVNVDPDPTLGPQRPIEL